MILIVVNVTIIITVRVVCLIRRNGNLWHLMPMTILTIKSVLVALGLRLKPRSVTIFRICIITPILGVGALSTMVALTAWSLFLLSWREIRVLTRLRSFAITPSVIIGALTKIVASTYILI